MSNEPITITDTSTPYLNFIAETKPDWMRKALKSTGWMMQKEIKQGIRSGAPGGRKYPNFMAPARRAAFESAFGAKLRKAYQSGGRAEREAWGSKSRNSLLDMGISARTIGYSPLGKLSNAVGYQYDKGKQSVRVGWLSNSAKRLGERIEEGYTKQIAEPMRKKLFAAGVPLPKGKSMFKIQPRHTYGPMKTALQPKLKPYIEGKIGDYAIYGPAAQSASRRNYKVR